MSGQKKQKKIFLTTSKKWVWVFGPSSMMSLWWWPTAWTNPDTLFDWPRQSSTHFWWEWRCRPKIVEQKFSAEHQQARKSFLAFLDLWNSVKKIVNFFMLAPQWNALLSYSSAICYHLIQHIILYNWISSSSSLEIHRFSLSQNGRLRQPLILQRERKFVNW